MDTLYTLLGLYIFFMLTTIALLVFVFPFRTVLFNRWKLKIKGKAYTPVFIVYKNNTIDEVVVDTSQESFKHNEASYNIRPNRFYKLFGFQYSVYLQNNPEPMELQTDEKGLVWFEITNKDGEVINTKRVPVLEVFKNPNSTYVLGKIIDGKTYDNLLIRAYQAGMAWANRNANIVQLMLWIIAGLVVVGIGVTWWKAGQVQQVCVITANMLQNISATKAVVL